jgi:L-ascorbate metabolism protein UlaG (beta-lactamase superfamily)
MYAAEPASGLRVTWFGHSCLLVELDGVRVLIDPVWDERAAPVSWAGPKRFFAPTLPLELLPELDVILISHDHYDHLGQRTMQALAKLGCALKARWVTSLGVAGHLEGFGIARSRVTELDWTERTVVRSARTGCELALTAAPTRHFSGRGLKRNGTLWSSFVLAGDKHRVYFGADSGWWEGFAEIGSTYGPFDLTMLEIGAFHPLWGSIHLGPDGAARAFAALGGKGLLMPIHWGLFDLALHGWRQPIERMTELARAEGIRLWSPLPGLPTEVVPGEAVRSTWWQAD